MRYAIEGPHVPAPDSSSARQAHDRDGYAGAVQHRLRDRAEQQALHRTPASMGIYFGTVARSMPQLALLIILVLLPLQMLSGGATPRESMPELLRHVMLAAPTTHFVSLAQAILYRGAGLDVVWPTLLALLGIGAAFFAGTLRRVRSALAAG